MSEYQYYEFLAIDLRSLYIGWLSSVGRGTTDLHEKEPLSVNELGSLTAPRRTVKKLWENAKKAEKIRLEREKNARILQEKKHREEREAYLKNLANDFPKIWKSLQKTVKRGSGLAYVEVCSSIVDISEAYKRLGKRKHFQKELKKFMSNHMRRKALIQRLEKAGLWKGK